MTWTFDQIHEQNSLGQRLHVSYFQDGEWETLPLKEAGDQVNQIIEGAAGKAGQLPELVPQAKLESHLGKHRTFNWKTEHIIKTAVETTNTMSLLPGTGKSSHPDPVYMWKANIPTSPFFKLFDEDNAHQSLIWTCGLCGSEVGSVVSPPLFVVTVWVK